MPTTAEAKACIALAALAFAAAAGAAPPCPVQGDRIHWVVDYCMMKMETDDEIAVSDCIEAERAKRFRSACASNTHYKQRMCEQMVRQELRKGTVAQCVRDPAFKGRTVERGGVGG